VVWTAPVQLRWDAAAKRSVRAAIVIPGLFAFGDKVIANPMVATFAAIGGFAMLLLADFGGPLRRRFIAYVGLGVVGVAFISIGTLVSRVTWVAVVVALLIAVLVLFGGILSGYIAKGSVAALLLLVLPLTLPAGPSGIPPRLEGWGIAAGVCILAVFLLWRDPPQAGLSPLAANALTAIGDHLRSTLDGAPPEENVTAVNESVATLWATYLGTPFRPTGATLGEQAIVALVEEIDWLRTLTALHDDLPADGYARAAAEDRELVLTSVAALHDSAKALTDAHAGSTRRVSCAPCDEPALVIDLELLGSLRRQSADAISARVDSWAAAGVEADADMLECSFHGRAVATATAAAASSALVASGNADDDAVRAEQARWYGAAEGPTTGVGEIARQALAQADIRSVWLRNSLRGAIGFALAILVAKVTGVQHGFWVVLGMLGVLRSNALGTGAVALRAIAGTALGFIVGGALLVALGDHTNVLWFVLPLAVLFAGYAPLRISFLAGQAGFTVLLAVLFNIVQPTGWRVGLVRVEDVALGCAVSIVVGVLLWPRGAAPVMSLDLAEAYRSGISYLSSAVHGLLNSRPASHTPAAGDTETAAVDATAASRRLDSAFRIYLAEQGTKLVHRDELAALVAGASRLLLTANSLATLPMRMSQGAAATRDEELLDAELHALRDALERIANDLAPLRPGITTRAGITSRVDTTRAGIASRVDTTRAGIASRTTAAAESLSFDHRGIRSLGALEARILGKWSRRGPGRRHSVNDIALVVAGELSPKKSSHTSDLVSSPTLLAAPSGTAEGAAASGEQWSGDLIQAVAVSPESVCARWIHHHLVHLQAGVQPLAAAAYVLSQAHGPLAR
jgi:uncharacterized membrane protein YccC